MKRPRVLVLEAQYERIDDAVEKVLGEFPLDLAGKTVLLKPNMVGRYPPESHVNTHPSLVTSLVRRLRDAGARPVVGDNPGTTGYGSMEKIAEISGLKGASLGAFENIATEVLPVELDGGKTSVNVSKTVLDADVLVSLPKFKTHIYTRLTGALKNSYGIVVGGDKARLHVDYKGYREFSEMIVSVYQVRVPDLIITDAVVGLHGNGPTNRSRYPAGKLLASDNGVAMDTVMATMMGMRPHRIEMIRVAAERGLGPATIEGVEVIGAGGRLRRFRKPVPSLPQLAGGAMVSTVFPGIGRPRFEIDEAECDSCATCVGACPAGAMQMEGGRPTCDYDRCIACYCCMELCPRQAVALKDTVATRLYRMLGHLS